jgi:hypothetical protein
MGNIEPIVLFRRWAVLAVVVFAVDWLLGALIVTGVLWQWTFAIANPPFGLVHVWLHSHWTGTQTNIGGHVISDELALLELPVTAILQSGLYAFAWCWIQARRTPESSGDS